MSVIYLILLILIITFAFCALVSAFQFFIDLRKNSDFRSELRDTIKRVKKMNCIEVSEVEQDEADIITE